MTKNTGFIGYRIFLSDLSAWDGITTIERSFKKPISLDEISHRIVKFVRQNKLMEDVEGYKLINVDSREDLYLWRELTSHRAEWKFSTRREEEEE